MKRIAPFLLLLVCSVAYAGKPVNDPALERYFRRSMPNCPGADVRLETWDKPGPSGFLAIRGTHTSNDERCGRQATLLVGSASDTRIVGDVFNIPDGKDPIEKRLTAFAANMLKKQVTASLGAPNKEGLRVATITSTTPHGPFHYRGWVDKSGKFFIVGKMGTKNVDPGDTLLSSLGASKGAIRGNTMARIRIVELSDFQCPTCARAHELIEPLIKKNLNRISYTRLDLPLFEHHDWSLKAAAAGRAMQSVAPAKYWQFVDYIFGNQEAITKGNVDQMIKNFVEDNDIAWAKFAAIHQSAETKKALLSQVSTAFDNSVYATPTFIVNGQPVFYGTNGDFLRMYLEQLLAAK